MLLAVRLAPGRDLRPDGFVGGLDDFRQIRSFFRSEPVVDGRDQGIRVQNGHAAAHLASNVARVGALGVDTVDGGGAELVFDSFAHFPANTSQHRLARRHGLVGALLDAAVGLVDDAQRQVGDVLGPALVHERLVQERHGFAELAGHHQLARLRQHVPVLRHNLGTRIHRLFFLLRVFFHHFDDVFLLLLRRRRRNARQQRISGWCVAVSKRS
mmetsp:Transcript_5146/g.16180  ORF Transcript_5146/g.16180 Transcript_5146/m.16180 type:complete len:213 (-) Transcript_5146:781-1419(-)